MLKVDLINSIYKTNSTPMNKPVNKVVSNPQTVETSSLNALSSYAKAGISFKGKKQAKSEISVQSLQEKLNGLNLDYETEEKLEAYFDKIDENDKEALSFIDRVFSEPKLYGNKMITSSIYEVLDSADFEITNKVVDKYLSASKFYNNKWFQDFFGDAIEIVSTEDRFKLFDKFTDKSSLYRNKDLKQYICPIIQNVDTEDGFKLADKLLSTKTWYKNTQLVEDFIMIINIFTEEDVVNFYDIEDDSDDSTTLLGKGFLFESVEAEMPIKEKVQIQPDVQVDDIQTVIESSVEEEVQIQSETVEEEAPKVEEESVEEPVDEQKSTGKLVYLYEDCEPEKRKRLIEQRAKEHHDYMVACGFNDFTVEQFIEMLSSPFPAPEDSPHRKLLEEGKRQYLSSTNYDI